MRQNRLFLCSNGFDPFLFSHSKGRFFLENGESLPFPLSQRGGPLLGNAPVFLPFLRPAIVNFPPFSLRTSRCYRSFPEVSFRPFFLSPRSQEDPRCSREMSPSPLLSFLRGSVSLFPPPLRGR